MNSNALIRILCTYNTTSYTYIYARKILFSIYAFTAQTNNQSLEKHMEE